MLENAPKFALPTLQRAVVTALSVVPPSTSILAAIARMNQDWANGDTGQLNAVPDADDVWVVEHGHILGVLTARDVVRLSAKPSALRRLKLPQVMSHPSAILPASALAEEGATVYLLQWLATGPVAIVDDEGNLTGSINQSSLLAAIAASSVTSASSERPFLPAAHPSCLAPEAGPDLQHPNLLLKEILDGILAGYWDWDVINNTEHYSPGFKRMFGYADHELPNTPETWKRLIFEEDMHKMYTSFERHVQSHGHYPFENEVRYRHKDGSTVWVNCSGRVIDWTPDGQPARVVGCHVDITQRKAVELALKNKREELETFFQVALDLLCIGDLDGHFRRVNRAWENVLGYSVQELQGCSFWEFVHPDDVEATVAAIAALEQQQVVKSFVNRYRAKDGSYRDIEWYSRLQGHLIYAAARDITEQRLIENQLRKSAAHFKTAQRIAGLGSWEFDVETEKISWSDEVFDIFGRDRACGPPTYEELLHLYHPDDQAYHAQVVQRAMQTLEPYDLECRARHPNGYWIYIQARGEPIVNEAGQLVQLVGTVLDITERKLSESRLLQAKAQLEASNRELEAFAYSVSHDLRSPLRAIDGFSKALMEDYGDCLDAVGQQYFGRICHNVKRMNTLIDNLLRLSQVSRFEMVYQCINLSGLVQEHLMDLQASEPERDVEAVVVPDVTVWADQTLMGVVISNLLQNAWKFTSHQPQARIEFGKTEVNGQTAYFIRDDGAGFDMTYADMLFGVFQRLHNTEEFPGTGIGLATVQRAIHRHGGTVWAEGAVEQGATVYFTLPFAHSPNYSSVS